jgi:hypothetical protein
MSLSADKEQTVASTATLARKLSVQALGGGYSATVQARRLGIDYAPNQVGAQYRKSSARPLPPEDKQAQVRKLRIKQALKRARFAKKLLHKTPMGRIFFGCILLAATFGHDIEAPTSEHLGYLQSLARQAMSIRPWGSQAV